jgi:uncharacterized membrane protein YukC
MKVGKFLGITISVIGIIFAIWVTFSWIDTNKHNNPMSEEYLNYSQWNFFEMVSELI